MTESTLETQNLPVFEHVKRRDWGLGILAWEKSSTRGYVFENGQLRIMAQDFYALMREVDRPLDEVQALYDSLSRELDAARVEGGTDVRTPQKSGPAMSLDEQIAVFRLEYPQGFQDHKWLHTQRGEGVKSRLASHRDPAIAKAAALFGKSELDARLAQQQFRAVNDDLLALLRSVDLVPGPDLKGLEVSDAEGQRSMATAIRDLLHGEAGFASRFDRFLSTFEQTFHRNASWQVATSLPSLVNPKEHICIRPSSFREQAKWMAPRLGILKLPTAASYSRLLSMAKIVSTRLVDQGEKPRDLMDVHDFIRLTTRPAAKKLLLGLRRANPMAAALPKQEPSEEIAAEQA